MPAGKTAQLISSVQWGNSMAIRIGTNAANLINGTSGNDFIFGFAGDDLINGGAGNDWIFAGAGNDQLFGGDGNDWLFAGTGNDVGSGGDGNDFVFGEAGNDVLNGGRGSDTVDGGTGSDTLIFTDSERGGLDRYIGGAGQDSLVLEFTAARWADPAVKAQVLAYLNFIGAGNQGNFNLTTMNLIVSSVEALVVKVDGVIIDPRAAGNTAPTGQADSYFTGENGILNVSPVTERGTLVDNDNTGTGAFTVELVTGPARGAVALNADGTFTFNPGAAFDYLAAGQNTTETFTYRIVNSAGTSAPITVTLNIAGANDTAVIGGSRTGSVTEDNAVTTASGTVTVTDADAGQSAVANPGTLQGVYGSLALAANGAWVYTINNALAATQALGAGASATETFAVTSADGTAASSIVVTVNGTNDTAVIGGSRTGSVSEDNTVTTASGAVTVSDADTGQSALSTSGTLQGAYGSLALAADGTWVYTINNALAATQALGAGVSATETFAISSADGSANSAINISVNGTNDEADVSGDLTSSVTEDDVFSNDGTDFPPQTSGQITIADVDAGEGSIADPGTYDGLYGSLNLASDGSWAYTLDNTLLEVQSLGAEETVNDVFTLFTDDGTLFEVSINVQGVNDAAVVEGDFSDTIILAFEDSSASGSVTVTDIDRGEDGVVADTYQGDYGSLTMNADGAWEYLLDTYNLPFDEGVYDVFDTITAYTLGGDAFDITIDIRQNDFIIG
jgi:VCBS repeat-containing protein